MTSWPANDLYWGWFAARGGPGAEPSEGGEAGAEPLEGGEAGAGPLEGGEAKAETYTGSDPAVAGMVAEIVAEMEASLGEKVAVSDWDLKGGNAFVKETSLGDFATDAIYWQVSQAVQSAPDAAIINGGALRKSIKAGEIRLRDIYDVIPFGNQLCTIEVTGAQLLEALEAATYAVPEPKGAFPQVSQIKFTLDTTVPYQTGDRYPDSVYYAPAAPGSRVTITEVGGKAFDPEAVYTIATIDFVASGGDTYYCFAQAGAKTKTYVGYLDFDALANYMKTGLEGTIPEIYAEPQGRITVIETARQTPADHSRPRDTSAGE